MFSWNFFKNEENKKLNHNWNGCKLHVQSENFTVQSGWNSTLSDDFIRLN